MQQKIQQLSPVNRLKVTVLLYWLHFCEFAQPYLPKDIERFGIQLFCITAAFVAFFGTSVLVMQREPYIGLSIMLVYLGIVAAHAIYAVYQRFARPRFYWVGE